MRWRKFQVIVVGVVSMMLLFGCQEKKFAGDSGRGSACKPTATTKCNEDGTATPTGGTTTGGNTTGGGPTGGGPTAGGPTGGGPTAGGPTGGSGNPDTLGSGDGDSTAIIPKSCTSTNITIVTNASGTAQCPANSAAFAADDNNAVVLACCPLPAGDILSATPPAARSQCAANEIAVGASASGLLCAAINTARYKLSSPTKTCYSGSGVSGGAGSSTCAAPPATAQAWVATFGSDACIPMPYGGLITGRTGKYCANVSASVLYFVSDNSPVPTFK